MADSASFIENLQNLRNTQDKTKLLKLLIDIRKDVDCPQKTNRMTTIREGGFLKEIASFLNINKKNFVDICLSIIGNCCLDEKCSWELVTKCQILATLNKVIQRFPTEDSVNGRVCRIVGNLCMHGNSPARYIMIQKPFIVSHITKLVTSAAQSDESQTSQATINMAVRCLRELVNKQTVKVLVKQHSVLNGIGMLLIKYGRKWEETKINETILMNIIKLLQKYSEYRYYSTITQLKNTEIGDSIAYLNKILLMAPIQIVKILMNLLKSARLQSELPIPETFYSLTEVLRQKCNTTGKFDNTSEEHLKCICELLKHPGNRNNERCGESIQVLINILEHLTLDNVKNIECCTLITLTLSALKFTESLILKQIHCNVVAIIKKKLEEVVGGLKPWNVSHKINKKRRNDTCDSQKKRKRGVYEHELFNSDEELSDSSYETLHNGLLVRLDRCDFSPASSSESELAMSHTSGLSPGSSPQSQRHAGADLTDFLDSDDYSPVCSEVDETDLLVPEELSNAEFDKCFKPIPEDDNESPCEPHDFLLKELKIKFLAEVVKLMKIYTEANTRLTQLECHELLLYLVKCQAYVDRPTELVYDILDIIQKIVESHGFLLPLMKTEFVSNIHELRKMQHGSHCSKCIELRWISACLIKKISTTAQSACGDGLIAHQLLRGDPAENQLVTLVIPYIVQKMSNLRQLMLNCKGLEILMKLLQEKSELKERGMKTLCALASKRFDVFSPRDIHHIAPTIHESGDFSQNIIFRLDSGSLVLAERLLLTKNSDYFSCLFNSGFKESNEDEIALQNVDDKSFKCLLTLITSGLTVKSDLLVAGWELDTHLDVIALSDRFLMKDYCDYLAHHVEKSRMSPDSVHIIYKWSLESRTNILRAECIKFALFGRVSDTDRFILFKRLFSLDYTFELVEDLEKSLVQYLSVNNRDQRKKKRKRNPWSINVMCNTV